LSNIYNFVVVVSLHYYYCCIHLFIDGRTASLPVEKCSIFNSDFSIIDNKCSCCGVNRAYTCYTACEWTVVTYDNTSYWPRPLYHPFWSITYTTCCCFCYCWQLQLQFGC